MHAAIATEADRWRTRVRDLEQRVTFLSEEESRILQELSRVERQAGYYDTLAGDMKRDLQPPSLSGFMRSLRR